jgi:hypothetical protein
MKSKEMARLKSEKGMASIEMLPLMLIFVILISYTLGAFGVVHTGILNSIGSRAYAFETFRNRANLTYFRDLPNTPEKLHYRQHGNRQHTVKSEAGGDGGNEFYATERPIRIGMASQIVGRDSTSVHSQDVYEKVQSGKRNETAEVNPVWIKTVYGICLSNKCGD